MTAIGTVILALCGLLAVGSAADRAWFLMERRDSDAVDWALVALAAAGGSVMLLAAVVG